MVSRFFGKSSPSEEASQKVDPDELPESRGLEVTEDDPETAWSLWDDALASQKTVPLHLNADITEAPLRARPPLRATAAGLPPITGIPSETPPVMPAHQIAHPIHTTFHPLDQPATEPMPVPEAGFTSRSGPDVDEDEISTAIMGMEEKTPEQRMSDALAVVEHFHSRIANTIRTMWGYPECSAYINKLIMSGGDGMGHARVGFNQEAVDAMLVLVDLHDAQFGPPPTGAMSLG